MADGRTRLLLVGAFCGALGFGLGRATGAGEPAAGSEPARASTVDPAASSEAAVDDGTPASPAAAAARAAAPQQALEAENRALREELAAFRREKADAAARIAESEGRPVAAPPDLPERFGQAALVAHFQEALRGTGTRGQVQAVDCTEYPCFVHGRIELDGPDDPRLTKILERLRATYAGDEFYVSPSTYVGDDGKAYQRVSATFYPRPGTEEERAALNLRLRFRKNQYMDAPSE